MNGHSKLVELENFDCCSSLYLNVGRRWEGPEKRPEKRSWKVVDFLSLKYGNCVISLSRSIT